MKELNKRLDELYLKYVEFMFGYLVLMICTWSILELIDLSKGFSIQDIVIGIVLCIVTYPFIMLFEVIDYIYFE